MRTMRLFVVCICVIAPACTAPPSWTSDTTITIDVANIDTACQSITFLRANSGDTTAVSYSLQSQDPDGGFSIGYNDDAGEDELRCAPASITEPSYTVIIRASQPSGDNTHTDQTFTITVTGLAVECGDPDPVTDATFTTTDGNNENSVVTYACSKAYGHTAGDLTRTCSDGSWSGILPTCKLMCGNPDPVNNATLTTTDGDNENSVVTYACIETYGHTAGDLTRRCTGGSWSGILPTCKLKCGNPDPVNNATLTTTDGDNENSVVTYACSETYGHTAGDLTRTCTGGSWSGTLPTCAPIISSAQSVMLSAGTFTLSLVMTVFQQFF